jgi:hypothetical protein
LLLAVRFVQVSPRSVAPSRLIPMVFNHKRGKMGFESFRKNR